MNCLSSGELQVGLQTTNERLKEEGRDVFQIVIPHSMRSCTVKYTLKLNN